jgi:hypothetical protein
VLFHQWTEHCKGGGIISHYSAKCHQPIKNSFLYQHTKNSDKPVKKNFSQKPNTTDLKHTDEI